MIKRLDQLLSAATTVAERGEAGTQYLRAALERGLLRETPAKPILLPGVRAEKQIRVVRFAEESRTSTTNTDAARAAGVPLDSEGNVCIDGVHPNLKRLREALDVDRPANKGKGTPLLVKLGNENLTDRAKIRGRLKGDAVRMTAEERDAVAAGSLDAEEWLTAIDVGDAASTQAEAEYCKHVRLNVFRYGEVSRDSFQYHTQCALNSYRDMRRRHRLELSESEYRSMWYSTTAQADANEEDPQDNEVSGFTYPQRQYDNDPLDLPVARAIQPKGLPYTTAPIYCDNPHSRAEFCPLTLHEPWLTETLCLPAGVADWRKAAGSEYGQRELAAAIVAGSVVAQLPTGFGKSLPVMSVIAAEIGSGSTTVIVLPTNALKQEWLANIRDTYPDVLFWSINQDTFFSVIRS